MRRILEVGAVVCTAMLLVRRRVPTAVRSDRTTGALDGSDPAKVEIGPHSEAWQAFALEEYKSLRQESLAAMQNQHATVRYSLSVIGVLLALAFEQIRGEWDDLIFLVGIPAFAILSYSIYVIEFGRMVRVGRYIEHRESTFAKAYGQGVAEWESWLSRPVGRKTPRLPFYVVIPGIYFGAACFSVAIYVWTHCLGTTFCSLAEFKRLGLILAGWVMLVVLLSVELIRLRKGFSRFFVPPG